MEGSGNKFDLLANYLEPLFGNIYERDIEVSGYDGQQWTDELRDVVRHFISEKLSPEIAARLFSVDQVKSFDAAERDKHIEKLFDLPPWEVAFEVHKAAVEAAPTLSDVIGNLGTWPFDNEREDAERWLLAHGNGVDWAEIARVGERLGQWEASRTRSSASPITPYDLVYALSPGELCDSWEQVAGSAESDVTDEEWRLVVPHLDSHRSNNGQKMLVPSSRELAAKRRAFNAARYQQATGAMWTRLPRRYGQGLSALNNHKQYIASGLYDRIYLALCTESDARRIVDWLTQVIDDHGHQGVAA